MTPEQEKAALDRLRPLQRWVTSPGPLLPCGGSGRLRDPRLASFVNGRAPSRARAFLLALHDLGLDRRCPKGKSLQARGQDFQLLRRTQLVEMVNARLHDLKVLRGDVVGRDGVTLTHWPPPLLFGIPQRGNFRARGFVQQKKSPAG